jgi:multiple sugar transport system substrate-binding protein
MRARLLTALATALAGAVVASCGGGDAGEGARTLNWFIFNEPSGAPTDVANRCSEQSGGRYRINFEYLPSEADQQREQLVRRLGAEDTTIDLIGMDVIWTGEFANAGWIREIPARTREVVTKDVFDSALQTGRYENKLYAAPIWSNTQLLWYRKDRVKEPPETWDEMIGKAVEIGPKGTIQVQANRYEGLMVWTNQLIESAGGAILRAPNEPALQEGPTKRALAVMGRLSRSKAAPAGLTTSDEDSARLGFEAGDSSFMVNYPFVFPSAKENAPDVAKQMGAAKYPKVVRDIESKPPLGGINLAVSSFSDNPDLAFEAIECLVKPENQLEIAEKGGLPPVRSDLYDRPEIEKIYPGFAPLIKESIQDAAPRPSQSPAYQDLSLAVQRAVHPTTEISPENPQETYERLKSRVEQAVKREGLL